MPIVGFILSCLLKENAMNYTLTTNRPKAMSEFQSYKDWVIGYDKIFQTMLASTTNQHNYPPHNLTENCRSWSCQRRYKDIS